MLFFLLNSSFELGKPIISEKVIWRLFGQARFAVGEGQCPLCAHPGTSYRFVKGWREEEGRPCSLHSAAGDATNIMRKIQAQPAQTSGSKSQYLK